jgi:hypothetical protein
MHPKQTKDGFIRMRRAVGKRRIAAVVSGRKVIEHRPGLTQIQASEERWDALNHDLGDLYDNEADQHGRTQEGDP